MSAVPDVPSEVGPMPMALVMAKVPLPSKSPPLLRMISGEAILAGEEILNAPALTVVLPE